jgi:protein-tyrosine phosphatase
VAKKKMDFNWIVPGLAQGSFPEPPESAFAHFDVVVLAAEELQAPRARAPAGCFLFRLPLDDDIYRPVPPEVGDVLHQTGYALATYLAGGQRVLTTCAQGRNRSGILSALTLMYALRMPPHDAIKLIQSKRKWALSNTMFTQWLEATNLRG